MYRFSRMASRSLRSPRPSLPRVQCRRSHPYSRGKHLFLNIPDTQQADSSLLTRGAPPSAMPNLHTTRLIPAHAGSTAIRMRAEPCMRAHPRSREEHIQSIFTVIQGIGSSPLTRGALSVGEREFRLVRLIPAHAGSTRRPQWRAPGATAHPRSRGEHIDKLDGWGFWHGSSPLTRGAPGVHLIGGLNTRLIPAHAGSTRRAPHRWTQHQAHPRSRGEHDVGWIGEDGMAGSSPLTRGARWVYVSKETAARLIPAHAGSTPYLCQITCVPSAHPRSRGEHHRICRRWFNAFGSSPLTRGALVIVEGEWWERRLIPAHAGSTRISRLVMRSSPAHPRSRGEHSFSADFASSEFGSSPLTRGALGSVRS